MWLMILPGSWYQLIIPPTASLVAFVRVWCSRLRWIANSTLYVFFSSSTLSHNQTAKCTLSPPAGWSKHGNVSSFNLSYNLGIKLKNWLQLHNSVEVFMHEEMCYNGCRTALTSFISCRNGLCWKHHWVVQLVGRKKLFSSLKAIVEYNEWVLKLRK